jgi:hypothetical protein
MARYSAAVFILETPPSALILLLENVYRARDNRKLSTSLRPNLGVCLLYGKTPRKICTEKPLAKSASHPQQNQHVLSARARVGKNECFSKRPPMLW